MSAQPPTSLGDSAGPPGPVGPPGPGGLRPAFRGQSPRGRPRGRGMRGMRGRGGPPRGGRHSSYTPSERGGQGPPGKRHSGYSPNSPLRDNEESAQGSPGVPRSLPKPPAGLGGSNGPSGLRRSDSGSKVPTYGSPPVPGSIPPPLSKSASQVSAGESSQPTGVRSFSPMHGRAQPNKPATPPLMRKNAPNKLKAQLSGDVSRANNPNSGPRPLPSGPGRANSGGGRPLPKFGETAVGDAAVPDPPPRSPPSNRYPRLPPRDPVDASSTPSRAVSAGPGAASPAPSEAAAPAPAPSGKMTKSQQRQNVLVELYQTEMGYVEDLETLISVFIYPLRVMELVSDQVIYAIFSNVEVLLGCNKEMVKELDETTCGGTKNGDEVEVGQCFTKLADYFKMYKVYSANQQISLTTVEQQSKKNAKFKGYVDVCHTDPKCKGLFLQSFLIKPIQRVCKYPLLLRELIKFTPEDHPDYIPLQKAFEKINEVVLNINEGQREAEGLQRILDLQKLIDGIDSLVAPGRRLHKESDLLYYKSSKTKHPEKRHVFFFSDLIMLCTKKGDKKFEHKMSVPLEDCKFIVLADSTHIKNAFELQQKQMRHKCILSAEESEMKIIVREVKTLIREYQKKRLRELAEAKKKAAQMVALADAN